MLLKIAELMTIEQIRIINGYYRKEIYKKYYTGDFIYEDKQQR